MSYYTTPQPFRHLFLQKSLGSSPVGRIKKRAAVFIIENSCPFEAALLPKKGFKLIQVGMTHHIPATQCQGIVSHFDGYLINRKGHFNPLTLECIQGQLAVMSVGKGKIRRMP